MHVILLSHAHVLETIATDEFNKMAATIAKDTRTKLVERTRAQLAESKKKDGLVMEFTEWMRIKDGLKKAEDEAKRREKKILEQKALHEMSKSLVKNWENTIEGQRLKKLEARKIREEKEEEERVKLDIEEAKFQAAKRKEAIERAKTLLYYQTDRVKKFHGALKLSEVLAEREQQILRKKEKQGVQKKIDAHFHAVEQQEREQAILRDIGEAKKAIQARKETRSYQTKQIEEKANKKREQRQTALDEQKRIDEEVKQFYHQRKLIEEQLQRNREEYRNSLDHTMEEQNAIRDARERERLLEEKEIELFADAKKKMMKLRKDQEIAIFRKFQEHQQRMRDKLAQHIQKQQEDEDGKIAKAIEENEAKILAEERKKAAEVLAMNEEIFKHRVKTINDHRDQLKEEADKERELLKQRVLSDQKFHEKEMAKQQKKFTEDKQLQEYHHLQTKDTVVRNNKEQENEQDFYLKNLELVKVEEEQFQEYANKVINEAKQRKANIIPLTKRAHPGAGAGHGPVLENRGGIRPSYMVKDTTHTELPSYGSKPLVTKEINTHKRMGFNW